MNLDYGNTKLTSIQGVTSVEKTLKNYQQFISVKRSRSSLNIQRKNRNECFRENNKEERKLHKEEERRIKRNEKKKEFTLNISSNKKNRKEVVIKEESSESLDDFQKYSFSYANEQFKQIRSKSLKEKLFGKKFVENKKQIFKKFYEYIVSEKYISIADFDEIKNLIQEEKIDLKESDKHYNKVFDEYFKKRKSLIIKEIEGVIKKVIKKI